VTQFTKDVAAFVDALGMDEPGLIISLSLVPWDDEEDRDQFISYLKQEG
jgi:hypothetical protein